MNKRVKILIADDDRGHARLIRKNLDRTGILNSVFYFKDGQEVLDFLFGRGEGKHLEPGAAYFLLLDIHMPRVDGMEVLSKIKADPELRKIPVVILTTSDNPVEIERCHAIGCSHFITKPFKYDDFVSAIRQLAAFLNVVQVPTINRGDSEPG